ncbi:MAG: SDR family oxidoreductase [Terriglobales bacterium]|jgi:NAD(P)-dependent dehydrogenase (short-subunit alcohol dehydrogenase family)
MAYRGLDLKGRTAVVVGGTSGIGRAIAMGLANAGADVVASGRRPDQVKAIAGEIEAMGCRSLSITVDVNDRASLEHLLSAVLDAFEKVDILVNSAGRIKRGPTMDSSESDWHEILDTNLMGVLRACQVFGRHMLQKGYGRIINITSLNAFVALHEVAAYAASKAAVQSLTRSLAIEWAGRGVCVNAIAPGVFPTALNSELLQGTARGQELLMRTPMKRFGSAEEVVGAAILLASDAASFMTGSVVIIDGGFLASGVNQ